MVGTTVFSVLMETFLTIWLVFEISLIIRDRIQDKGKTGTDRGTRSYNFASIFAGLTIALILSGDSTFFFPGGVTVTGFWVGLCIMLLGFGLRIWAIVTLGASFRTTVQTHAGQQVVRSGPYKLVRHPSYSGILLICVGCGIAIQSWLSLAFVVVLPLAAFLYRIRVEEAVLVSSIGPSYEEYRTKTKKLIPWVW